MRLDFWLASLWCEVFRFFEEGVTLCAESVRLTSDGPCAHLEYRIITATPEQLCALYCGIEIYATSLLRSVYDCILALCGGLCHPAVSEVSDCEAVNNVPRLVLEL